MEPPRRVYPWDLRGDKLFYGSVPGRVINSMFVTRFPSSRPIQVARPMPQTIIPVQVQGCGPFCVQTNAVFKVARPKPQTIISVRVQPVKN